MKAMIYTAYGSPEVLHPAEIETPMPKPNEIRVKVCATTVTAGDWRMRKADPFLARMYNGLLRPRKIQILGFEVAGDVDAVGSEVTRYKPGDAVFASCDIGFGGYAEYKCLPEDGTIALKPGNLSYGEAAAVPVGGVTALRFLRGGHIGSGQRVMIYGASGSVGTYAVQIAKHFGAEVTGVCSTANLAMVKLLGADHVFDYTKEDYTTPTGTYDIICDTVGKSDFGGCVRSLKEHGVYLRVVHMGLGPIVRGLWVSMTSSKSVVGDAGKHTADDLAFLKSLIEDEAVKPVIDRYYRFDQIPEAHHYVQQGHKKGNVVIDVDGAL